MEQNSSNFAQDATIVGPYFENEFAEFWVEEGILHFVYKPGAVLTLEAAKLVVKDRLAFQKGESRKVLCDLRGLREADRSARDYLAKQGSEQLEAVAMLIDSSVTRIIMNFYINLSRPETPTRVFTDRIEALEYLRKRKKK